MEKRKVIALGFFDGVHLGHQALLRRTVERAGERDLLPAMFTFDRSPREFVTGTRVPLLTAPEERREAVRRLFAIEEVIVAPFDEKMMTMPWVDFVLMLAQEYQAGWLVAGHDFRFGHRNAGTPALLSKKAAALGMGCDIIPAVTLEGVTVSSTHIRVLLERGEAEEAARFLGRPFALSGAVRRDTGAPVVTLIPPPGQLIPACGVYETRLTVGESLYPTVTYVRENNGTTVESRLPDQTAPVYGRDGRLEFLRLLGT